MIIFGKINKTKINILYKNLFFRNLENRQEFDVCNRDNLIEMNVFLNYIFH